VRAAALGVSQLTVDQIVGKHCSFSDEADAVRRAAYDLVKQGRRAALSSRLRTGKQWGGAHASLGSPPLGLPRMPSVPEVFIPADHPPQGRALADGEGIVRPEGVPSMPKVVRQS
jgi:hypothetical protein